MPVPRLSMRKIREVLRLKHDRGLTVHQRPVAEHLLDRRSQALAPIENHQQTLRRIETAVDQRTKGRASGPARPPCPSPRSQGSVSPLKS